MAKPKITRFKGLNTVEDEVRLAPGWLTTGNDVDITSTGALERRQGYSKPLKTGAYTSGYATIDEKRLYAVRGASLVQVDPGCTTDTVLATVSSIQRMHWDEINGDVYASNGPDKLILRGASWARWGWDMPITPTVAVEAAGGLMAGRYGVLVTHTLPDGRETGSSPAAYVDVEEGSRLVIGGLSVFNDGTRTNVYIAPANSTVFELATTTDDDFTVTWDDEPTALGRKCTTQGLFPPPREATLVAFWNGRAWLALFDHEANVTFIFSSQPLGFHLFDLVADFIAVPAEALMIAGHKSGLVIGTTDAIHVWNGERIDVVADYGVVPGQGFAWDRDNDPEGGEEILYFWSQRGMCRALPFQNLTEGHLRVAPGLQAAAAVRHADGQKHFVVALHKGGEAFNPRSTP